MKTVQILGMADNLSATPTVLGAERWCSNAPRSYRIKWPAALDTYTRWFNMHSKRHMLKAYPTGYAWYAKQTKPIYLQEAQPDIPASIEFPKAKVMDYFAINGEPMTYFTCSLTWFMALAIMEGFERIELWGFRLARDHQYDFERPCVSYWVEVARSRGIEVYIPPPIEFGEPGDPLTYDGPLYGFMTT